ncbi:MAG: short-chain dehydrogenase [Deltaproteobacteria bacterium CG23_combo_of_CG06-09_8_20_14_all_51_20]|nr:MAG: short-chain dehydrogenase [Desulfobacteraceae bacterium CG2_30_51_40]PIP46370.1 MAG: short-chain dehydrogenase [Deltaproteobacteria bacterium CG23_combo_of_CG06-09_8_20_14_all_51_20]
MIGIVSYGGYIPRLRLNRMSIVQNMGWFAPAIIMVAQGERSFCNWDEDTITMAVEASRDCIKGCDRSRIDGMYLCSTTLPFADRSCAGLVKTALNLKDEIMAEDFTTSLRAGTSALVTAFETVKSGDRRNVLVTASDKREAKSAYFYEMWFGDGAASVLVGDTDVAAEYLGSYSIACDFVDHYRGAQKIYDYMWEERWVRDEGYSKIIPQAVNGLLSKLSISMDDVDKLVFPCFFKAEHRAIAKKLGAGPEKVADNLHEVCGETGAAHPLVMLVKALEEAKPGDRILLAGFGQGCDALYFRATDSISGIASRRGVNGSLEKKLVTDNYAKFLKFRGLIETEMGIRAEAPTQTAMTVLWRKRKMITGLVGGRCTACGTPQFPKMDICVNPDCGAIHTQEDYEFSELGASVKSFTGDLLAVSVDPPAIYGMIQFDGGGRFMADFTDCELSEVKVGQKARLVFRRRYIDKERGFTGYFWKAVPIPGTAPKKADKESIRFDGRVAIVTGAGAGLGKAYALELAKRGAKVVVNDLGGSREGRGGSTMAADAVVEEIKKTGGEAVADYNSVATSEGGEGIVQTAIKAFGRCDILINNAGILRDKTLAKMEPETWNALMDVHLKGAYNVTRPAFEKMREGRYGRIIFTTSAAGLYGNFGQANYSAAKMGLIGFMNTVKLEGERHNIKANTVAPIAGTRLTEDILPPEIFAKLKPEFVAPIVLYMASEACKENGMIVNAGMGYFNRAAVVTGKGAALGKGDAAPSPEDILKNWDAVNSIDGAVEYSNATESFAPLFEAGSGSQEAPKAEGGELTVTKIFEGLPKAFRAEKAAGVDVVFQFVISGTAGGSWFASIKEGACKVEEGAHKSPTTTIKMKDEDFVKLIKGELNAMAAFTGGKLRVEGDIMKSQLIEKLFKF